MLNLHAIAETLVVESATVASVAQGIGTLEEKVGAEYKVKPHNHGQGEVLIGIRAGDSSSEVPKYVQIYFPTSHPQSLAEAIPFCQHWKEVPNNPGSSPYLYACCFDGSSTTIEVKLFAELTGEIGLHSSHLKGLLLQRNVWQPLRSEVQ